MGVLSLYYIGKALRGDEKSLFAPRSGDFLPNLLGYSKLFLTLHPISPQKGGNQTEFFEKRKKVENLSPIICEVNFLCLLLQSKTVATADVAQLASAADL